MNIKKEILKYYESGVEKDRLSKGFFQLERARTQELILRYLKRAPLNILDVGGGAGFYSFWLSELGHNVYLVDPVEPNVQEAKNYSRKLGQELSGTYVGEATQLKFDPGYFDVVLMMGPLYHLTEKSQRAKALIEAYRVLAKKGLLIASGISRYASMFNGFFEGFIVDQAFLRIMSKDLKTGQHRNPTPHAEYFTTSYFHKPEELSQEIEEAKFKVENLLAVESFGWLISDFNHRWKNEIFQNLLLSSIRQVESDPSLLGISAHLLCVGRKY